MHGLGPTRRGIRSTCFARGSSMKLLLVPSRDTCFLCTGLFCLVTVVWTTKDTIALRKHVLHREIKYKMDPSWCLGYMSAYHNLDGRAGAVLEQQKWHVTRPHPQATVIQPSSFPPAFKHTYSPSPSLLSHWETIMPPCFAPFPKVTSGSLNIFKHKPIFGRTKPDIGISNFLKGDYII